jgi:hypothetical protein
MFFECISHLFLCPEVTADWNAQFVMAVGSFQVTQAISDLDHSCLIPMHFPATILRRFPDKDPKTHDLNSTTEVPALFKLPPRL